MPLALPTWLMPSVPKAKPRMARAQYSKGPLPAKKPRSGRDTDAHTPPAQKQELGEGTDAHTRPAKKQKLGGDTDAYTHPAKQQKPRGHGEGHTDPAHTREHGDAHTNLPVQGLPTMSTRDGLGACHDGDAMAQTEQDLFWASPKQATASKGTVAVLGLSSFHHQLFPDVDKSQHGRRISTKKTRKQADPGRPQKRVQMYNSIKASQRCGYCKTCMNRSMKKACLTRRAEMDVANNGDV